MLIISLKLTQTLAIGQLPVIVATMFVWTLIPRSSTGKKTAYVPVKDIPADQVIVTEKTNILLR